MAARPVPCASALPSAALALVLALAAPARAADPIVDTGSTSTTTTVTEEELEKLPSRPTRVDEITVTVEKQEELLQRTSASVTALNEGLIEDAQIESVRDVPNFVPNLNMTTNIGGNTGTTVNIRGAVTSDPIISLDPTVGIYLDGVYIAKGVGSLFDVLDLERVEVLRGPQGTLWGRNTNGGAINLVSRKPSGDWSLNHELTIGNEHLFNYKTSAEFALFGENGLAETDALGTLDGRITFATLNRRGFYENDHPGGGWYDDLDRLAGHAVGVWRPVDDLSIEYNYDVTRGREDPSAFQLSWIQPGGPVNNLFLDLSPWVEPHRSKSTSNDGRQRSNLEVYGHSGTIAYDLPELPGLGNVTLKAITGYRDLDNEDNTDLDGSPLSIAQFHLDIAHDQLTQELQVLGNTWTGRIEYVLGYYYFQEEGTARNRQTFFFGTNDFQSDFKLDNSAHAGFGHASIEPLDGLTFFGGIRYTWEHREMDRDYACLLLINPALPGGCTDVSNPAPSFSASDAKNFDNVSWTGGISYQWTDDLLTYFKVSTGFKSGGFNGRSVREDVFRNPYEEETLTAYEAGFKSSWLDDRFQLNGSGFFSDYDDLQLSVFRQGFGGAVSSVENAGKAEIWGAEIEGVAVPVEGLTLNAGYGLLLPTYEEFEDPELGDVKDQRDFPFSPEHTVNAGAQYTFPPCEIGTFSARVDWYWQSHVNFAVQANDFDDQGAYGLLSASLTLADVRPPVGEGSLRFQLWGKNLTDRKYRTHGIDFAGAGYAGNTYGDPLTVGGTITWEFTGL